MMTFKIWVLTLSAMFLANSVFCEKVPETYVKSVYDSVELRNKFAGFLDEVLRQVSSVEFFCTIDQIKRIDNPDSDTIWYEKLARWHKNNRLVVATHYSNLCALSHQKKILTKQAKEFFKDYDKNGIQGCLEIGTPATYINALSSKVNITGTVYALMEKQQFTDIIQSPSLNLFKKMVGYDIFLPLNDYAPITEEAIPSNSLDLIICYQGLHHIPKEKLAPFIASLHRILRPGGMLLVRDHDATSATLPLVYAAHEVFNIFSARLSLDEEKLEYRNFQPIDYWIDLVSHRGFVVGDKRLVQKGDPTINTMIACIKKPISLDDNLSLLSKKLLIKDMQYERKLPGSYLSGPEWFNVDSVQEYGNFINHTPFYKFPYFKSIKTFWYIFAQSFKSAVNNSGYRAVLLHDSMIMNIFIGTMMTLEYATKGLISIPVNYAVEGTAPARMKAVFYDPSNKIGLLGNDVAVIEVKNDADLVVAEIPRYMPFVRMVKKLKSIDDIILLEIGGQKVIHVKMKYKKLPSGDIEKLLVQLPGYTHNYSWEAPSNNSILYAAGTLKLSCFKDFLKILEMHDIEFVYAHDY